MKKWIAFLLALTCVLGLCGCLNTDELYGTPVFETENIAHITFYTARTGTEPYEVPSEHMEEITAWLDSFIIAVKLTGEQSAGLNSESVKIVYTDGTVVEKCLDTMTVDGVTYYLEYAQIPECYYEILEWTD